MLSLNSFPTIIRGALSLAANAEPVKASANSLPVGPFPRAKYALLKLKSDANL
nr:hypothetical protein [Clostridium magnum]